MFKIHISRIINIEQDKIYFRDDRGDISFIKLEPCANSFEARHNIINKSDHEVRCVGERSFGEYAYYELYTIGHTQIYMDLKTKSIEKVLSKIFGLNFHEKDFQRFYSIQKQLNENG